MLQRERPVRRIAATTDWNDMRITEKVENLNERLVPMEDIGHVVTKIYRYIKVTVPIVVTAAISSGLVSGRWGAFFHALFNGG